MCFELPLLPGLKHFRYVKRPIVIIVQKSSGKAWLFCEFLIQFNFLHWCSKKLQESKMMSVQPVWFCSFFHEWQTWRSKYSFLSILRSLLKVHTQNFIHNIHTKIATDPSSTSHVENYLILLNKLTSKGAVRYRYGRCGVCGLALLMYKCRILRIKIYSNGRWKVIIYVQ